VGWGLAAAAIMVVVNYVAIGVSADRGQAERVPSHTGPLPLQAISVLLDQPAAGVDR
jgi:hypothetical protein